MEITNIIKRFNISFVLILPLFRSIISNIKLNKGKSYNIQGLFYECGLINTYLYDKYDLYDGYLRILFDKKKLLSHEIIDENLSKKFSLLELIISSKFFYTLKEYDKYIVIYLKIDEIWSQDITKIIQSHYSKVSDNYKEYVKNIGIYKLTNDDSINYLYITNLPAKIVLKNKKLEDAIKKLYNVDVDLKNCEYFQLFNKEKECLKIKNL
jgi:hypothetical protein